MAENISYLWAFKNYVTTLSIIVFLIGCFSPARARDPQVIISEVAWMGTEASYTEEWIELYNRSDQPIDITDWQLVAKSGTPSITLQGTIPASGYFLLERTSDETIPSLPADQIYSGSLANDGEVLQLINSGGETVDQNSLTDGGWPAGSNPSEEPEDWGTMERIIESSGEVGGWATFDGCSFEAQDSEGSYINGTPGLCNCSSSCPSGSIKWSFGQAELGVSTSPTLDSEGNIYIGTKGGKIYSLSPNGKTRGDVLQVEGEVSGLSIDEDGILYAGTAYSDPFTSSKVYAFDTTVWEKRWEFSTGGAVYGTPSIDSEKGYTCCTSYDSKVYGLSKPESQNQQLWQHGTDGSIISSCTLGPEGLAYIGSGDGVLQQIEPPEETESTPTINWAYATNDAIMTAPAISRAHQAVYFGTQDGSIYGVNISTGELNWRFQTTNQIKSSPAIGKEGLIYVGSTDGYLYALRPAELESTEERLKWKLHVGAPVTSTPAIGSENTLYFGAQDGYTYALELPSSTASSPTVKWKKGLDEEVRSSPALSESGNLYVTSHEGSLYALRTAGEQLESTSWPTFQHDSRRTGKVTPNHPPQARIDGPQNKQLKLGHFLNLDASRSTDGDGGTSNLQFYWEIKDKPDTSSPRLTNEEGAKPTLFTDKPGTYTLQLTLTDRFGASQQEDISVEVTENSQVKNETLQGAVIPAEGHEGEKIIDSPNLKVEVDCPSRSTARNVLSYAYREPPPDDISADNHLNYLDVYGPELKGCQVDITLPYSKSDLPEDLSEKSLTLYYYHQNSWNPVDNSKVDLTTREVKGTLGGKYFSGTPITAAGNLPPAVEVKEPSKDDAYTEEVPISWEASDADGDDEKLEIDLLYRTTDQTDWRELAKGLDNTGNWNWKITDDIPPETYKLQITAVDPEGLKGEAESPPFEINEEESPDFNRPPVIHGPNPVGQKGCVFWFSPEEGCKTLTLFIYDLNGRPLFQKQFTSSQNRFPRSSRWVPQDQQNRPLANGLYLYRAKCITEDENIKWTPIQRLVVDRQQPKE